MKARFTILYFAVALALWPVRGAAQDLDVRLDGAQLRVSAPGFHFIAGDVLKRLRDGGTVTLIFQLGAATTRLGPPQELVTTRFAVSFDLWEERYAITRTGAEPRSISNLPLSAAEKWCLDSLSLQASGLPPTGQFWVSLQYRVEEAVSPTPDSEGSLLTLSGMIEILSQRVDRQRSTGKKEISAGPYRLSDLRRNR